jgi:hypothetical protein
VSEDNLGDDDGSDGGASASGSRSPYRGPAFAVLRAVVVLVVAAVGYQAVVPSTHVVRSRLARLVVTRPTVKAFDVKPSSESAQQAAQSGVTALTTAAKRSPNQTGIYAVEWLPSPSQGAVIFAFLLPSDAQATTALAQLRGDEMGPQSYANDSLALRSTFTVAGVPGSSGSVYTPTSKTATPSWLSVAGVRDGRVVALAEVVEATPSQADSIKMASTEYAHLRGVEPGFSLDVVTRSLPMTIVWVVGAVLVAALAALGPVGWRRRAERRAREREEERARVAAAPAHHIVKRRRS